MLRFLAYLSKVDVTINFVNMLLSKFELYIYRMGGHKR